MEIKEKVNYWLDNAKDDIESAKIMYNGKKYLYTGFMLQQCAEKALKAYYIYKKEERQPYTHNLEKLAVVSEINVLMTEDQLKLLSDLAPIYIDSRYEDYKSNLKAVLTEEYCSKLIEQTEALCLWIETLIL